MKRRRSLGRSSASFTRYPIIALLLGSVPAVALDDSALRSLTRADGIIPVVAPGGRAATLDNSIAKLDAPGVFLRPSKSEAAVKCHIRFS
jgi:hypothetical protein